MAYITAALQLIQSYLSGKGWFSDVIIGLPAAPPETPFAAIFLASGTANLLTTSTFHRQREVTVRVYMDVETQPRDEAELALDKMVYDIEAALSADLSLNTTGWVILGDITEAFDYVTEGNRPFRVADITLPISYRA